MSSIEWLIKPLPINASMTIFTSFSLLGIYLFFLNPSSHQRTFFLGISFLSQLTSLSLYLTEVNPKWSFLYSSSLPTTIFIFLVLFFIMLSFSKVEKNLLYFGGPVLMLICLFFLYAMISDNLFILGITENHLGVGLSPYTLASFFVVSLFMTLRNSIIVRLDLPNLNFHPTRVTLLFFCFSILSFLLYFCPGKYQIVTGLILNLIFFTSYYLIFLRKLITAKGPNLTICAWSKNIKVTDNKWVKQEEIFEQLGMTVTHGISPKELMKINDNAKKKEGE